MSADRKIPNFPKKGVNPTLSAILDFGPETEVESWELSQRIQQIIKKLQEINTRIDNLAARL